MTERQQLLGILGLIYLSECLRWVRRGGAVFNRAPDLRVWRKSPLLNNSHGDLHIGWPLPPFGEFLVARGLPWSIDTEGLVTATQASLHPDGAAPQAVLRLTWEECTRVTIDGEARLLSENQSVYVPLGAVHRMENPGKVNMVLIEVQTGTYLGEDDIIRYEDVYARGQGAKG